VEAAEAARAAGEDTDPLVDVSAVLPTILATVEASLAAGRKEFGVDVAWYFGSTLKTRLPVEPFTFVSRPKSKSGDFHIYHEESGRSVSKAELLDAGWYAVAIDYESNFGVNVDLLEMAVHRHMRSRVGTLWMMNGAGGQSRCGVGSPATLYITLGPVPQGWAFSRRAMEAWEGPPLIRLSPAGAAAPSPAEACPVRSFPPAKRIGPLLQLWADAFPVPAAAAAAAAPASCDVEYIHVADEEDEDDFVQQTAPKRARPSTS